MDIHVRGGALLTVPFLLEQIWIRGDRDALHVTEVYDFLLQADEAPIKEVMILLPHFCRSRDWAGAWRDHVRVVPPGGEHTGWGWFYADDDSDDSIVRLTIADPSAPVGRGQVPKEGRRLANPQIAWHAELTGESLDLMERIRKSLYVINLGAELAGGGAERCWLRLIAQPQELDLSGDVDAVRGSGLFKTGRRTDALVTCPAIVRRWFLQACKKDALEDHGTVAHTAVQELIVNQGFQDETSGLRIMDHRVVLIGYGGIKISPRPVPETIKYQGTQPVKGDWTRAPVRAPLVWPATVVRGQAHYFAGGSAIQANRDLVSTVQAIVDQAGYKEPKTAEQLAALVCPEHHWEAICLIENMKKEGLLRVSGKAGQHELLRPAQMGDGELARKICTLRRLYSDPNQFKEFPEAMEVFRVLHPFRVDYGSEWVVTRWFHLLLLWVFALSGPVALLIWVLKIILTR